MDPFSIALGIAGSIIIAALTVIALKIAAWVVKVAIKGIIGLIKKIHAHVVVVRKRKRLVNFIKLARDSNNHEIADELDKIRKNHQALVTPVDDNGEEDWEKLRVAAPESDEDELADGFMVSETGRVDTI